MPTLGTKKRIPVDHLDGNEMIASINQNGQGLRRLISDANWKLAKVELVK